ncbi:winged helix-turn-helix transcriptional regulator [Rhodococcus sp. NBC_00294]|uniref:winged helix-turn-helix transcriptional regulator n=1 Tax=Rhodococcus sp. NBC_00294 TaxID=2976004 RepID=UPI002E2D0666|nr:helix-turn-helix domain-containing protein [Rhodococcus sp. NBC_00294]
MPLSLDNRLADRTRWKAERCSITLVLEVLSTKASFMVLRESFYGTSKFDDFVMRTGASAPTVSRSLRHLESAGVLARTPYRDEGSRPRDEYRLTAAGEDLLPVVFSLVQWGDAHLQGGAPPLAFVHRDSGEPVRVGVSAGEVFNLTSRDIEVRWSGPRLP